jgi:four helix bundle protein
MYYMSEYKNLIVWQHAFRLCKAIFQLTETFPSSQRYCLTSQLQRAALSVVSNIAEGSRRGGHKEWRNFIRIAYGSASEVETQLLVVEDLSFGDKQLLKETFDHLGHTLRLLNRTYHAASRQV